MRVVAGAVGTAVLASLYLFGRWHDLVERLFVERLGPRLTALVAAPVARAPVSLAEWIEGATGLVVLAFLVATVAEMARTRSGRGAVARRAVVLSWTVVTWILVAFELLWGLAYARPAAEERFGFRPPGAPAVRIEPAELTRLGDELVDRANDLYLELHGWPDGLEPTHPSTSWLEVDAAIDRGWERMVPELGLHPSVAAGRGPSKRLRSSPLWSWLGIGGFYFPFTGEANINAEAPSWQQPHTIAHEKAHQRFVASEDEANFHGWLACVWSDDPFVRYGGWMFAQRQVLFALSEADPIAFSRVIRRRLPGVQRDVNTARAFWTRHDGPLERVGETVNDTYLKMNAVPGGVRSYGHSLVLVVQQLRARPSAELGYTPAP